MTTATSGLSNSLQSLMATTNGASAATTTKTEDSQARFLKLLTTQLKNQDPLNPMDNAQMTSQLAQISTVDGIERLNTTLQKILGNSADAEATQAAGLVGHSVMVAGNGLTLGDSGAGGGVELAAAADKVTVTIKDSNGILVRTLNLGGLDAGLHNFVWDGKSDTGTQAANGSYTMSISAKQGSNKVDATALEMAAVSSVMRGATGTTLDLGKQGVVGINDIKQIF